MFLDYGVFYETAFSDALIDGIAIGFAHYRMLPETFTAGPGWFLDDLCVVPDARGSGAHTAQRVYNRLAKRLDWVTYEREID